MGKILDGEFLAIAGESVKSTKISPSKILRYTVVITHLACSYNPV